MRFGFRRERRVRLNTFPCWLDFRNGIAGKPDQLHLSPSLSPNFIGGEGDRSAGWVGVLIRLEITECAQRRWLPALEEAARRLVCKMQIIDRIFSGLEERRYSAGE